MGSTNPDKKRLGADIEDECKSIAWQVRAAAACGTVSSCHAEHYGMWWASYQRRHEHAVVLDDGRAFSTSLLPTGG